MGDLYTPAPRPRPSRFALAGRRRVHRGPLRGELSLSARITEPNAPRGQGAAEVTIRLILDAGASYLAVALTGDNQRDDHRLRIILASDVTHSRSVGGRGIRARAPHTDHSQPRRDAERTRARDGAVASLRLVVRRIARLYRAERRPGRVRVARRWQRRRHTRSFGGRSVEERPSGAPGTRRLARSHAAGAMPRSVRGQSRGTLSRCARCRDDRRHRTRSRRFPRADDRHDPPLGARRFRRRRRSGAHGRRASRSPRSKRAKMVAGSCFAV